MLFNVTSFRHFVYCTAARCCVLCWVWSVVEGGGREARVRQSGLPVQTFIAASAALYAAGADVLKGNPGYHNIINPGVGDQVSNLPAMDSDTPTIHISERITLLSLLSWE